MGQRTRKLMSKHESLHPRDDVDWLYVLKKEGKRGLANIEDNVDTSIQRLVNNIEKHEGGLITVSKNDTDHTVINRMTRTKKQKWEEKQFYVHFKRLLARENLDVAKENKFLKEKENLSK